VLHPVLAKQSIGMQQQVEAQLYYLEATTSIRHQFRLPQHTMHKLETQPQAVCHQRGQRLLLR
jgi:hypothetical protein